MTDKLKETIKEELAKLPKENQEAINSLDWATITEEIGKKNLLSEDEINNLQLETFLVLVGLEDPQLYSSNIEDEVGTSKDEAEKIAIEIIDKVFTPINDILVENIKKSGKINNSNPEQTLDFILSGGDYSAFVSQNSPLEESPIGGGGESTPSLRATPQEGNKIPLKPKRITDINPAVRLSSESSTARVKSKFTI